MSPPSNDPSTPSAKTSASETKAAPKRVCLAYSGGLDTSVILRWLIEEYGCEVVAYCADVGQEEELAGLPEKARASGAQDCIIRDVREEFVRDYVFPAVRGGAIYEGVYLLGTALARPLIAKHHVDVARETGCDAVAHGATGKGNDQVRFELTFRALAPELQVIAPWRDWDLRSRTDCMAYAQKYDIPVSATVKKPYSIDRNLLHCSFEGGILEDPWRAPEEEMFILSQSPEDAPEVPAELIIGFERGDAVSVDGEALRPAVLLARLNQVAGIHGVGRVDLVENRFVGLKSRGVYETPGGTVLHVAHRAIESITIDREVMHEKDRLAPRFAELIYNGFWFAPEMDFLRAAIDASQKNVTGDVRVKLYKGAVHVTGRRSPFSLYSEDLVTFEEDEGAYDQADATGFIRLQGLRLSGTRSSS
jgi:argininosuccinate synthase